MAQTTTTHRPIRAGQAEAGPAVINVRRPAAARGAAPHLPSPGDVEFPLLDDTVLPPTALRLPDLAALARHLPQGRLPLGAIGQWAGIGLGALLALWLIFGGGGSPPREVDHAPKWNPPNAAHVQTPAAPSSHQAAEVAPPAPVWQAPTGDSGAPAHANPNFNAAQPSPHDPVPPNIPEWDEPAAQAAPPQPAPQVRTAQRADPQSPAPPTGAPQFEAPPLGITVGVPQ